MPGIESELRSLAGELVLRVRRFVGEVRHRDLLPLWDVHFAVERTFHQR